MCATCFAQASVYVGGALGGLQVMAAKARARRRDSAPDDGGDDCVGGTLEPQQDQALAWSA